MDEAWDFLNQELRRNSQACRKWCQDLEAEFGLGARLAHAIMTASQDFCLSSVHTLNNVEAILPRTLDSSSAWKELYHWRHPWFDLNLLQLGMVFDNECAVHYLCQHPLLISAESYRDHSSQLVNHPLHLAFSLSGDPQRTLKKVFDDIPESLIQEEGLVDLTMERLRASAVNKWQVEQTCLSSAVPSVSPDSATLTKAKANAHPLLRLVQKTNDTFLKTEDPFWKPTLITPLPEPEQYDPEGAESLLRLIFRKMISPKAQPSTVEMFWKIISCLCTKGITEGLYSGLALSLSLDLGQSSKFLQDILLCFCQLTWAISEETRGNDCLEALSKLFYLTVKCKTPYLTAASCVPRPLLQRMIDSTQTWDGDQRDLDRYDYVVEKLQGLMAQKTLKNICHLIILDAVKGNVCEFSHLQDLPLFVREMFPVPFNALHKELVQRAELHS